MNHNVKVQHELDNGVVTWVITDETYGTPTNFISVRVDLTMPEQYMESVFALANDLPEILNEAAAAMRQKIMGV